MTCIIGLRTNDGLYIAGDSAGVESSFIQTRADAKVFVRGEFLFGFTSSFRMGQLIRYKFEPPAIPEKTDLAEYMVTTFIDKIRTCLQEGGYAKKKDDVESGGTFVVGIRNRLFVIEDDYQVGEWDGEYVAVGCGRSYALGAMAMLEGVNIEACEKLNMALQATTKFCTGVCPPFKVVTSNINEVT